MKLKFGITSKSKDRIHKKSSTDLSQSVKNSEKSEDQIRSATTTDDPITAKSRNKTKSTKNKQPKKISSKDDLENYSKSQKIDKKSDKVNDKKKKLSKENKKNSDSVENLIAERNALSTELKELKATVDSKISRLTDDHNSVLLATKSDLTFKHNREVTQLKENYETTISALRTQLLTIEDKHLNEVEVIRQAHSREMEDLRQSHELQQNQLIDNHCMEMSRNEETQRALEEQNEYLDAQIKERDDNLTVEVESQVKARVQKYDHIEAELQSLRDVIDIKSVENKKLTHENAKLQIKAEEAMFLKHEMGTLRDTNDQLRATLEMKTETERNLNVTQEELKREISMRDNDTRKYQNKCEELEFKLMTYKEALDRSGIYTNGSPISPPKTAPASLPGGLAFAPPEFSTPLSSPRRPNGEDVNPNGKLVKSDTVENQIDIQNTKSNRGVHKKERIAGSIIGHQLKPKNKRKSRRQNSKSDVTVKRLSQSDKSRPKISFGLRRKSKEDIIITDNLLLSKQSRTSLLQESSSTKSIDPGRDSSTKSIVAGRDSSTKSIDAGRDSSTKSIDAGRDSSTKSIDAGRDSSTKSIDAGRDSSTKSIDAGRDSSTKSIDPGRDSSTKSIDPGRDSSTKSIGPGRDSSTKSGVGGGASSHDLDNALSEYSVQSDSPYGNNQVRSSSRKTLKPAILQRVTKRRGRKHDGPVSSTSVGFDDYLYGRSRRSKSTSNLTDSHNLPDNIIKLKYDFD